MHTINKHFHSPALGLFIIRLVAGAIFLFHGISKLSNMEGTIAFFGSLGLGAFTAWLVAIVEVAGGAALILGLWSRMFSALLGVIMIIAILKVKIGMGFAAAELELMLLATAVAVLFSGCGRYSVCAWNHRSCESCKDDSCGCAHM